LGIRPPNNQALDAPKHNTQHKKLEQDNLVAPLSPATTHTPAGKHHRHTAAPKKGTKLTQN